MNMFDLSVIIVNYNTKELTIDCVRSVYKYTKDISFEIILVDNASSDGTVSSLKKLKLKNLKIIESSTNLGFGGGNNKALQISRGKYILFLNSDTLLFENTLGKLVSWMKKNPDAGALGCALLDKNKRLQTNGGDFPTPLRVFLWATFLDDIPGFSRIFGSYHLSVEIPISNTIYKYDHQQDWISGALLLIRKEVAAQVGGFDDDIFMYGEDVEYSYRIKKEGWEVWYTPTTKIIHFGSSSSTGETVNFMGSTVGKKDAILSELSGLKSFYKKHYSSFDYGLLLVFLKIATILRIVVFGIIGNQGSAIKIYVEAYKTV